MDTLLIKVVLGLVVLIAAFMVFRAVILWYYKIDERLKAQEKTNLYLAEILKQLKEPKV